MLLSREYQFCHDVQNYSANKLFCSELSPLFKTRHSLGQTNFSICSEGFICKIPRGLRAAQSGHSYDPAKSLGSILGHRLSKTVLPKVFFGNMTGLVHCTSLAIKGIANRSKKIVLENILEKQLFLKQKSEMFT